MTLTPASSEGSWRESDTLALCVAEKEREGRSCESDSCSSVTPASPSEKVREEEREKGKGNQEMELDFPSVYPLGSSIPPAAKRKRERDTGVKERRK